MQRKKRNLFFVSRAGKFIYNAGKAREGASFRQWPPQLRQAFYLYAGKRPEPPPKGAARALEIGVAVAALPGDAGDLVQHYYEF